MEFSYHQTWQWWTPCLDRWTAIVFIGCTPVVAPLCRLRAKSLYSHGYCKWREGASFTRPVLLLLLLLLLLLRLLRSFSFFFFFSFSFSFSFFFLTLLLLLLLLDLLLLLLLFLLLLFLLLFFLCVCVRVCVFCRVSVYFNQWPTPLLLCVTVNGADFPDKKHVQGCSDTTFGMRWYSQQAWVMLDDVFCQTS